MVLDIRDNPGGNDATAQAVAGRFASQQQIYMTVSKNQAQRTMILPNLSVGM